MGILNIYFRVDSSTAIGTGHIMRCLTLASEIKKQNVTVAFICRNIPQQLAEQVRKSGYHLFLLPKTVNKQLEADSKLGQSDWLDVHWEIDAAQTQEIIKANGYADWLVIDHYGIDYRWENMLRTSCRSIFIIDDLADRKHDCDILLDQNYYHNMRERYHGLINDDCKLLLGPKYALLREEFRKARKKMKLRNGTVQRIMIFLGGSDPTNETVKALKAIQLLGSQNIWIDVVVGASNPYVNDIKKIIQTLNNVNFHYNISNIATIMANADLAIGAGGSATWERCYLGLPTITILIAKNQIEVSGNLAKIRAIWNLGWHEKVTVERLANTLKEAIMCPEKLLKLADESINLMEGYEYGRIAAEIGI